MNFGAIELDKARFAAVEKVLDGAVVAAAVATVPLLVAEDIGVDPVAVSVADWLIWSVFVVEYVLLWGLAPDRSSFVRRNWLAAAVIVLSLPALPGTLQLARLARLGRVLRVAFVAWRALATLRAVFGRRELVEVGVVTAFVMVGGGALLTVVEPDTVKGSLWEGVWWAVVTATTVGYGDITPATTSGRLIAIVVMVVGIGAMSTFIAAVSSRFVEQDRAEELSDIRERLARIEAHLEQLSTHRER